MVYQLCMYRSVPGKRPCTSFKGVNVAASIQTYGNYVPGKRPHGPNCDVCLSTRGRLPGTLRYIRGLVPAGDLGHAHLIVFVHGCGYYLTAATISFADLHSSQLFHLGGSYLVLYVRTVALLLGCQLLD